MIATLGQVALAVVLLAGFALFLGIAVRRLLARRRP